MACFKSLVLFLSCHIWTISTFSLNDPMRLSQIYTERGCDGILDEARHDIDIDRADKITAQRQVEVIMEAASENVGVAASMLNAVLATLKAGQEGDALDLLKCGEEKGIEPDIVSISLCTYLLLSSGDDGSAEDLLGVARKKVRRKRRRAEAAARR